MPEMNPLWLEHPLTASVAQMAIPANEEAKVFMLSLDPGWFRFAQTLPVSRISGKAKPGSIPGHSGSVDTKGPLRAAHAVGLS